ncbi:MAG: hypothetical protein J3R72DRAFT_214188 [Linnemannia gamsii]|nr:MAG: hypothetical protein J3R72DRAFT_214188 [Linnemannia gamsii]
MNLLVAVVCCYCLFAVWRYEGRLSISLSFILSLRLVCAFHGFCFFFFTDFSTFHLEGRSQLLFISFNGTLLLLMMFFYLFQLHCMFVFFFFFHSQVDGLVPFTRRRVWLH